MSIVVTKSILETVDDIVFRALCETERIGSDPMPAAAKLLALPAWQHRVQTHAFDAYRDWEIARGVEDLATAADNHFRLSNGLIGDSQISQRLSLLDFDVLHDLVGSFCLTRYGVDVESTSIYGGWIYGPWPDPTDLDLKVILSRGRIVERVPAGVISMPHGLVSRERVACGGLELTVVGREALLEPGSNRTVLRTAVILGTTAKLCRGVAPPIGRIPMAALVFHAVDLATWGFKGLFEEAPRAARRAHWRLVEAELVVRAAMRRLGYAGEGLGSATTLFSEGNLRFLREVRQLIKNIERLKQLLRERALSRLVELESCRNGG